MALLNERLLIEGEANAEAGVPQASSLLTRKRVVLALLAVVGVACLVVGSVAASGAFSRSSPATSSNGQSFSVVDPILLQRRPKFTAPIGSLANAPQPTVIASNDKTETATLDFKHSHVTPQGHVSHTQLTYTVTKHRNAHCPAKHESVLAIDCLPNRIRISFTNASKAQEYAANWQNETILFLRSEWGCGAHIRQFVKHPEVTGRFLYAWTVNSSFATAFPHANVSFFTNHTGDDGPVALETESNQAPFENSPSDRRRHHSWLHNVIKHVASAAGDLVKVVLTGDLDKTMTPFNSHYSIPATTLSESVSLGSARLTYSGLVSLDSSVSLNIKDYMFQSVSASLSGSVTAQADLDLQAHEQYTSEKAAPLTNSIALSSGAIEIFGISVVVSTYVQVFGSYSVQASVRGSLTGTATATGSAFAGMEFALGKGISTSSNAQLSGKISYSTALAFDAQATASITPQVFLKLDYIGGPTASFTVYGDASLADTCVLTQDFGTEIEVGAELDVSIPHIKTIEATTAPLVLSKPKVFWTGNEKVC